MRRVLNQVANAACLLVPRLGHNKTIWALAHRLCRLAWIILHKSADYIEFGKQRDPKAIERRTTKLVRALRALGYQVIPPQIAPLA